MKQVFTLFLHVLYCAAFTAIFSLSAQTVSNTKIPGKSGTANLLFTENRGQITDEQDQPRPDILFSAHSNGAKVFLTANSIYYQFERTILPEGYQPNEQKTINKKHQKALNSQVKRETYRFSLLLHGANQTPVIRKEKQNVYTENFFLAHCNIAGVHTYERLVYENIYPGIDWVIYAKSNGIEYDFVVHPGANPNQIRLQVKDAVKVHIAANGDLIMTTDLGEVTEAVPVSYCGDKKIATAFSMGENGTIGFSIGSYDKTKKVTIDPSVTWATYFGGTGTEGSATSATDAMGNIYLGDYTESATGIAAGGYQTTYGGMSDAYLVKFSSGGARLWATYYGGSGRDLGFSCALDATGNIYLAGYTESAAGIASGGFQNTYGGGYADAFLVKFNSSGARLWATYYGGRDLDDGYTCLADRLGNLYLAGFTLSGSGIASGGVQNSFGGSRDAFLAKFNSSGSRLWATYYGGTDYDYGFSIATDTSGNVYLGGDTKSTSGIATGGFQNTYGGGYWDSYLVKINDPAPLPLTLLQFSGKALSPNEALLSWRTANEVNVSHFELQKSTDNLRYAPVATMPAKGGTQSETTYSYEDKNLSAGTYFYRLRMVDKDSKETYSAVVTIRLKAGNLLTVYPVPAKNVVWLDGATGITGQVVQLLDVQGRALQNIRISQWPQPVNISALTAGTYYLRLPDGVVMKWLKE